MLIFHLKSSKVQILEDVWQINTVSDCLICLRHKDLSRASQDPIITNVSTCYERNGGPLFRVVNKMAFVSWESASNDNLVRGVVKWLVASFCRLEGAFVRCKTFIENQSSFLVKQPFGRWGWFSSRAPSPGPSW